MNAEFDVLDDSVLVSSVTKADSYGQSKGRSDNT